MWSVFKYVVDSPDAEHQEPAQTDDEEKKILNERVELWLEYFVSSATFNREEDVNLFEFMDYFTETQKFV